MASVVALLTLGGALALATPASAVIDFQPASTLPYPSAAAQVGDLNGDSIPDLAVASGGSVSSLRGDGAGAFQEIDALNVSSGTPISVAIGSLNGDSVPDLATTWWLGGGAYALKTFAGNGDGTFDVLNPVGYSAYAPILLPTGVAIGDFNADGFNDVVVLEPSTDTRLETFLGSASGLSATSSITNGSTNQATSLAVGKLNGDSKDDVAISALSGDAPDFDYLEAMLGNTATFVPASGSPFSAGGNDARTVVLDDFNGDSKLDLAVTNEHSDSVGVKLGAGDGTFTNAPGSPYTVGENPWGLAVGNATSDSYEDLLVGNDDGDSLDVLQNNSLGQFYRVETGPFPLGAVNATWVGAADFDLDGNGDAAVATGSGIVIMHNVSRPPAAPTITSTTPDSPSQQTSIYVKGTSEGSLVQIFAGAGCSTLLNYGFSNFDSPGIQVNVAANATTTLSANTIDGEGTSACSAPFTYAADSIKPAPPALTGTSPVPPANDTTPQVQGSAEAGTTVKIYDNAGCSGSEIGSGTAGQLAGGGIVSTVPANSATDLYATATDAAGNTSNCSSGLAYVEDSTPPAEPGSLGTAPGSPSNDPTPEVGGSAEAGTTVKVYANASCSGPALATGPASTFNGPGITVNLGSDGTFTFHAATTDGVNQSSCSSSSTAYTLDTTAPPAPSLSGSAPASPANANQVIFKGVAQAASTVSLFGNGNCSGPALVTTSAASFTSPGFGLQVPDDSTTTVSVTAADGVGNVSVCSAPASYVEDSTAPDTVVDSVKVKQRKGVATAAFHSTEGGATFECRIDQRPFGLCTAPMRTGRLRPGDHILEVRSIDRALNLDPMPEARRFHVRRRR